MGNAEWDKVFQDHRRENDQLTGESRKASKERWHWSQRALGKLSKMLAARREEVTYYIFWNNPGLKMLLLAFVLPLLEYMVTEDGIPRWIRFHITSHFHLFPLLWSLSGSLGQGTALCGLGMARSALAGWYWCCAEPDEAASWLGEEAQRLLMPSAVDWGRSPGRRGPLCHAHSCATYGRDCSICWCWMDGDIWAMCGQTWGHGWSLGLKQAFLGGNLSSSV